MVRGEGQDFAKRGERANKPERLERTWRQAASGKKDNLHAAREIPGNKISHRRESFRAVRLINRSVFAI